jgi:hypothetical protein
MYYLIQKSNKILTLFFLAIIITFGLFQDAAGQSETGTSGHDQTFQISLLPGISNTSSYSTSRISFNIIGGYNGSFHGFEIGSAFNMNRYNIRGLQVGGVANINSDKASGLLLSGGLNYSNQFSAGLMLGGIVNISPRKANGVLLTGGLNYTYLQHRGLMLAGVTNISEEAHGVSISPLNISKNHTGVQVGVLNVTRNQKGTQVGLFNFVGEGSDGSVIGLLSFVRDGRYNLDLWANETGFVNGGVRIGTKTIYNVLNIGYNTFHGDNLWQIGIGIGYHYQPEESRNGLETDLIYYNVNHDGKWTTDVSNHTQLRFHYIRTIMGGMSLFTGPSLNLSLSNENLSSDHIPYHISEQTIGSNKLRWWLGWTLGIQPF